MGIGHAILVNGQVIPVDDILEWARWFEAADRTVARTEVVADEVMVSTVFLGSDHSFLYGERPLWFETMVFGGDLSGEMDRYETLEEAMQGHERMVARVKEVQPGV